jgi:L,D-transpeptidase catalytic domain
LAEPEETALSESKTELASIDRPVTGLWRRALLASVAALFVASQAGTADAQFFRQDPPARKANKSAAAPSKRDVPIRHPFGENMPKGPLQLMVSIGDQRAVLYSNGIRVADTKISTGTPSHPTPTGIFSIIQKNRWHRSNLYGNAPMFYMHRLTWSGIALHEGHLPGYAASHGCIRMPTDFVSRLWNVSKMGMRVVVTRTELTPQDFAHAKLFNPAPKPADDTPRSSQAPEILSPTLDPVTFVRIAAAPPAAGETRVSTDAPDVAAGSPPDAASPMKRGMSGVAGVPATIDPPAFATDVAASPDAPSLAAQEPLTTATVAADTATSEPTRAAETQSAPTATPVTSSESDRPAISPNELRLPRPAPLRSRMAEPTKSNGQVAVFISGKEKRIYVRHAFVPLFDMPIEIENPAKPLGTHTFTALEVADDGARMRWNLISMPLTVGLQPPAVASKKGAAPAPQRKAKAVRGAVITSDASNATEALDRVAIPQEAIDRIAELLSPGSSLIISDEGLGRETGRYTEFIVETR